MNSPQRSEQIARPHQPHGGGNGLEPVLEVNEVSRTFKTGSSLRPRLVSAVDKVTLSLAAGETLGIVGESGCGKSTLGRILVGLEKPDHGTLRYHGQDVTASTKANRRLLRRGVQMIFQDPYTSLDPRMTVAELVTEPLAATGTGTTRKRRDRAIELLDMVGMTPSMADRYPNEFSGGQRQRVGIARSLALNPDVLVCDEPVSALDVSVQAQVVNLLRDLQRRLDVALVFISHDLSVVRHIADRVAVMYLGRLAETGPVEAIFEDTAHPYTRALLSASPALGSEERGGLAHRPILQGEPPSPANPPSGCRFHPRCPMAQSICATTIPSLRVPSNSTDPEHFSACHFAENV